MKRHRAILLTLCSAALMLPMLGSRDVVTSHEGRVIQTAREMAASGWPWNAQRAQVPAMHLTRLPSGALRLQPAPDEPGISTNPWLVPTMNGVVRLQKPPLPYWCDAILFKCFGDWGEGIARLPPALMAILGTLLMHRLGRRMLGRVGATLAPLVWLSSYLIVDANRKAMADPYLAFFTLTAVLAWVEATLAPRRKPLLVTLFYLSLALGALAKGPVILLHAGIAVAVFHACYRKLLPGPILAHAVGVVLFAALAAPWPLYVLRHIPHASDIWRYESVGELGENGENAERWWFYLPQLFLIALPWIVGWAVGIATSVKRRGRLLFPLAWFAATVIFFSFVNLKKNAYLLPAMPAQTLLIAVGLRSLIAAARRRDLGAGFALAVQAALGIGFAVALPIAMFKTPTTVLQTTAGIALCVVGLVLVMPMARVVQRRRDWPHVVSLAAIGFGVLLYVLEVFVDAPRDNLRSPRLAGEAVRARLAIDADVAVYHRFLPPEAAVYVPVGNAEVPSASRLLVIVGDRRPGAAPLEPVNFQPWFSDRAVGAVENIPLPAPISRRWTVVELYTEKPRP